MDCISFLNLPFHSYSRHLYAALLEAVGKRSVLLHIHRQVQEVFFLTTHRLTA